MKFGEIMNFNHPSVRVKLLQPQQHLFNVNMAHPLVGLRFTDFAESQDRLQKLFNHAGNGDTKRHAVCREALKRMGNCKWTPPNYGNLNSWQRDDGLGRDFQEMNCWEGVFYLAFQAGIYDKKELVDYYNSGDKNDTSWNLLTGQTSLGDTMSAGEIEIPMVGDLVIWPGTKGGKNIIIHVGIYMGMEQGQQFFWQNGKLGTFVMGFPNGMFSIMPVAQSSTSFSRKFYVAPWA